MAETIKVPCFGQPVELGMAYDCTREQFSHRMVYKEHEIKDLIKVNSAKKDGFNVFPSDNIDAWASAVGIKDSMKTSIMCGLVVLNDTFKYIYEMVVPSGQARVTLHYKIITQCKRIGPSRSPPKIQPPRFRVTHVVKEKTYGAQVFFIFEKDLTREEVKDEKEREMVTLISKLTKTGVDTFSTLDENEKLELQSLNCRVYGDIKGARETLTGMDALDLLSRLPSSGNEVPIEVTLEPLPGVSAIGKIKSSYVDKIQTLAIGLTTLMNKCDRLKESTATHPRKFRSRISRFRSSLEQYCNKIQPMLAEWIRKIRTPEAPAQAQANERSLKDLFDINDDSAFALRHLKNWIVHMETLAQLFIVCQEGIVADVVEEIPPMARDKLLVFFSLPMVLGKDPYISELEKCKIHTANPCRKQPPQIQEMNQVFSQATGFARFAKANKYNKDMQFAVVISNDDIGCFIREKGTKSARAFHLPLEPRKVTIAGVSEYYIRVEWQPPEIGSDEVHSYIVKHRKIIDGLDSKEVWDKEEEVIKLTQKVIEPLEADTMYQIGVAAVCRNGIGEAETALTSVKTLACQNRAGTTAKAKITTGKNIQKEKKTYRFVEQIKKETTILKSGNASLDVPTVYQMPMRRRFREKAGCHLGFNIGDEVQPPGEHRVIILVGATGSGKTSLIDGIFNHILGVKWEDNFRFKVVDDIATKMRNQAQSQTQNITSYTLGYHEELNTSFGITIVDTPGIGDTRGFAYDRKVTEDIQHFICNANYLFDRMHAICFVVQASQARLTESQHYILNSLGSLFGKDVNSHLWLLITFADNQKPPVLHAFSEAGIPYSNAPLVFNNSAWFVSSRSRQEHKQQGMAIEDSDDEDTPGNFDKIFWKMGKRSFRRLFSALESSDSKRLSPALESSVGKRLSPLKVTLDDRHYLEIITESLKSRIRAACFEYDYCQQEKGILRQLDTTGNAKSTEVVFVTQREVPKPDFATNCRECGHTCHFPCKGSAEGGNNVCWVFEGGTCGVCSKRCNLYRHLYEKQVYVDDINLQIMTASDVKNRYCAPGITTYRQMLDSCDQECKHCKKTTLSLIKRYHDCLLRLDKIAERPYRSSAENVLDRINQDQQEIQGPVFDIIMEVLGSLRNEAIKYIEA